jgi:hypothetical protein
MSRSQQKIQERNDYIRNRFRYHRKKNPKWTIFAVIEEVASEVWLESTTVGKILKADNPRIPDVKTIAKRTAEAQLYLFKD